MANKDHPPLDLEEVDRKLGEVVTDLEHQSERVRNMDPAILEELNPLKHLFHDHYTTPHSDVGPSSAMECGRKHWLAFKRYPKDWISPAAWKWAAARGSYMEPLYSLALGLVDKRLTVTKAELLTIQPHTDRYPEIVGTPDGLLNEIGAVLELKSRGYYVFEQVRSRGVMRTQMEWIVQANLYMEALDRDWALIAAFPYDTGAARNARKTSLRGDERKLDRDDRDYTPHTTHHLEWIRRDPAMVKLGLARMRRKQEALRGDVPPERDYDPFKDDKDEDTGRQPCFTICSWHDTCMEIG